MRLFAVRRVFSVAIRPRARTPAAFEPLVLRLLFRENLLGVRAAALSPRLGGLESNEISNPGHIGLSTHLFPNTFPYRLAFRRPVESTLLLVLLVQQPRAPSPTWTRGSVSIYSSGQPPSSFLVTGFL